ncbi:hypothetical protein Bbelb_227310 [Branchiostoma belcheri]|nr:hypothetical protein Bbelb_227310 [Branchiostoma belcheri]
MSQISPSYQAELALLQNQQWKNAARFRLYKAQAADPARETGSTRAPREAWTVLVRTETQGSIYPSRLDLASTQATSAFRTRTGHNRAGNGNEKQTGADKITSTPVLESLRVIGSERSRVATPGRTWRAVVQRRHWHCKCKAIAYTMQGEGIEGGAGRGEDVFLTPLEC